MTVTFTGAAGRMAEFIQLIKQNARTSLEVAPGCRRFDVCTDPELPGTVFLYELYDDRAAFDGHLRAAHFRQFDAAVAPMVAGKAVRCFSRVAP